MEEETIKDARNPIKCNLCNEPDPPLHCEECQHNVCLACVGKHLSNLSVDHKVVPYEKHGTIPKYLKCRSHSTERCELHCQRCDIPVCNTCLLSNKHKGHTLTEVREVIRSKKEVIEKDFEEIKQIIYPKYEEILVQVKADQSNVGSHFEDLTKMVTKQGEEWHMEIDKIVSKLHIDILEKKQSYFASLKQREENIASTISNMKQSILELKRILDFDDLYSTAIYESKNVKFSRFPEKLCLPTFLPKKINRGHIRRQFGVLTTDDRCSFQSNLLLETSSIIEEFRYGHRSIKGLACPSEYELWTICDESIMLYSDKGELLQSIKTEYYERPVAIAVTKSSDLVYADSYGNINIVEGNQVKGFIKLQGWKALNVCSTSLGELLVIMNDGKNSTKVMRYSGSTEKQTIQFDDDGQPLFSSRKEKYLAANRNFDICVADLDAHAVVVVNQNGKLKYKYTGQADSEKPFDPIGIATDSQSRVLIAAKYDSNMHVLDQEGRFLSLIYICVHFPYGFCVDVNDSIFAANFEKIYKIKYCT